MTVTVLQALNGISLGPENMFMMDIVLTSFCRLQKPQHWGAMAIFNLKCFAVLKTQTFI